MELASRIVAILLGLIAGIVSFPYLNTYLVAILALIGAIAIGVLVFGVVDRLLGGYFGPRRRY